MTRAAIRVIITVVLTVGITVGVSLAMRAADAPRDVVLVTRGMAFFAETESEPNPTIHVRPGELVRFVVRNDSLGYTHDFWAPELDLTVDPLAPGEIRAVIVRIPAQEGHFAYVCRPHAAMMRGVINVSGS